MRGGILAYSGLNFVMDVTRSGCVFSALDILGVLWTPTVIPRWGPSGLVGVRLALESAWDVLSCHFRGKAYVM